MPVTDSLPPTPPSYLNVWSEELCAQTELFPLRVIMAANRWRLGRESLGVRPRIAGGRGAEMHRAVQFCLKKLRDDFALYLIFNFKQK